MAWDSVSGGVPGSTGPRVLCMGPGATWHMFLPYTHAYFFLRSPKCTQKPIKPCLALHALKIFETIVKPYLILDITY